MKNLMLVLILVCSTSMGINSHNDLVHASAHIGMSYIFNTMTYALVSKLTKNKVLSLMIAIPISFSLGVVYKYIEDDNTLKYTQSKQMIQNTIGISLSTYTIMVIDL